MMGFDYHMGIIKSENTSTVKYHGCGKPDSPNDLTEIEAVRTGLSETGWDQYRFHHVFAAKHKNELTRIVAKISAS